MKTFTKKVALIIDGFSTGQHIAPALKGRGYECIHILSDSNHPKKHKINAGDYVETLVFNDLESILDALKIRDILFCIPGDESGVTLADQISDALNLPTSNGVKYTAAKRNKYLMNEVARNAGLSVVRHCKTADLESLLAWIKVIGSWPMVLKPLDSASGDNVHICHNVGEVTTQFYNILSSTNKFGHLNQELLAEEFNPGVEYIVNTVSSQGKHHVVEIWRMTKFEGTIIHDTCEFVNRQSEAELFLKIQQYCLTLLDAFEVRFGACTIELKCTDNAQPILIEIGARLMGDAELALTYDLLGYNQLSLMLDAYLTPRAFDRTIDQSPECTAYALAVLLTSSSTGTMTQPLEIISYLNALSCLFSYQVPDVGDALAVTRNIATCPGIIYLKHSDKALLEKAHTDIREFEQSGLYENSIKIMAHQIGQIIDEENFLQDQETTSSSESPKVHFQYFGDRSSSPQPVNANQAESLKKKKEGASVSSVVI